MVFRNLALCTLAIIQLVSGSWFFSDERQNVLQMPLISSSNKTKEVDLFALHKDLISIESVTNNEHAVGVYLVKYLKALNLTVEIQPVALADPSSSKTPETVASATEIVKNAAKHKYPPRFNVIAYPKSHQKTRILMSAHMDVVPPWYDYSRDGDVISGRGSVDDKACIAAQIKAFHSLRTSKQTADGDIGLLFVVGEETDGAGMRAVNVLNRTWEAVIFGEPTESKLAAGHKGILAFTLSIKGRAAHSGYPWLGISANSILLHALVALQELEPHLPASDKMGETTLNVGFIQGGVAANVVPERAHASAAVRIAAGKPAEIKKMILQAIQDATAADLKPGVEVDVTFSDNMYGPVHIDCDIEGFECITVNYGTDIRNLDGDHKRYLYGPGSIMVAHSDHEALKTFELEKAVEDYKKLALAVLDN